VPKSKDKTTVDKEVDEGRREFVRKAAYVPPALVALGFAAHSPHASAQIGTPPPPASPQDVDPIEEDLRLKESKKRKD